MKRTIAAIIAMGPLAAGLSGQLDFSSPDDITYNDDFFPRLARAMHYGDGQILDDQLVLQNYTSMTFGYNVDTDLLPVVDSGLWQLGTDSLPGTYDGELRFQYVPNLLPEFLVETGDLGELKLEVAFFHFDAAATNTVGVARNMSLADSLELFRYSNSAFTDNPPISYELSGPGPYDVISFYATVEFAPGAPPQPVPYGPHFQDDKDYWRVFQLQDSEADGVIKPAMYILALEDMGAIRRSDIDFNDGFFLVQGFITPIPEPSLIGLGGIAALLGFIAYRRRRTASK